MIPDNITYEHLDAELLRRKQNMISSMFPDTGPLRRELYTKHMELFSSARKIRAFRAANRVGKSLAGAFEVTCHLTGKYPHWWTGKRFARPVNVLVAGESGKLVRDSIQMKLIGPPAAIGTGMIPYDCIIERRAKAGIADAVDTVRVKHVAGESILQFQAFDQGREAFQATERDVVWLDEEPPLSVFSECVTRTMTTQGVVLLTFTPLKGISETVQFLQEQERGGKISIITASWADAPHLSEKDQEEMLAAYPPYQRDARTKGIPALGSGAIYPVSEETIVCDDFPIPRHYQRIYGLDVGWNRTAAVWLAVDPDTDIAYAYSEHYLGHAEPSIHAEAIRGRGEWISGVIDPAANGRAQADGEQLIIRYRALGLSLQNANNAVEAGIYETWQRLSGGQLRIFKSLSNLRSEYRVYRRDERGKVVKENDHAMDALRYAVMALPLARSNVPEYYNHHDDFSMTADDRSSISGY